MIRKEKNYVPTFATERKWYVCKECGKKILIYNDVAICRGVFVKCKKCGAENEIII